MSLNLGFLDLWGVKLPATSLLDLAKDVTFTGETNFLQHENFVRSPGTEGNFLVTKASNKLAESFPRPWRNCGALEAVHILLLFQRFHCGCQVRSVLTDDCLSLRSHIHTRVRAISVSLIEGQIHFSTSYPSEAEIASKSLWIQRLPRNPTCE